MAPRQVINPVAERGNLAFPEAQRLANLHSTTIEKDGNVPTTAEEYADRVLKLAGKDSANPTPQTTAATEPLMGSLANPENPVTVAQVQARNAADPTGAVAAGFATAEDQARANETVEPFPARKGEPRIFGGLVTLMVGTVRVGFTTQTRTDADILCGLLANVDAVKRGKLYHLTEHGSIPVREWGSKPEDHRV